MEVSNPSVWEADWAWGVPLIVLTSVVHVLGLGLINDRIVLAIGRMDRRHSTLLFAVAMSVAVSLATILHALEAAVWAAAFILLRALPDMKAAMLYSVSALTTYGHASTLLAARWEMLGALEALNGMLLFGLTTAFLFAMIQEIRSLGSRDRRPKS
jgi:MFS superfamily sulfate permease-like transporter